MGISTVRVLLPTALLLLAAIAGAQTTPPTTPPAPVNKDVAQPVTPPPPVDFSKQLTTASRMDLIRGLQAEYIYAKRSFPQGKQGLTLKDGTIGPDDTTVRMLVAKYGPSVLPGDKAQITDVIIGETSITFEINGGPQKKSKWYQRIEIGGNGGTTPIAPQNNTAYAKGSMLIWQFDHFVPDMTVAQAKALLAPVFDFSIHSATQTYTASLSPKLQEAIKNHQVLVGMDREMVVASKGRPDQKIREKDEQGRPYEEWMYGQPPQEVAFVRFVGDKVVRLEIMPVDGSKIVKTQNEVDANAVVAAAPPPPEEKKPAPKRPTLYKPGEDHTANPNQPVIVPPSSGGQNEPEWGKPKTDTTTTPPPNQPPASTTPATPPQR